MITAIDTETFLFYPGYMAPELVCVSWADKRGSGVFHHSDPRLESWLRRRLNGRTIFAMAPYDLAVLARKFPSLIPVIFKALDEGRVHDVQTREKLLDLARGVFRFEEDEDGEIKKKGYSLAEITMRRLGRVLDKDTYRLRYHELYHVPLADWPEGAKQYADDDAVAPLQIYRQQRKLKQYLENEPAQVRAHFALHLMSCWGFRTDPEKVDELEERVRGEIEKIQSLLIRKKLVRPDGTRSMKRAIRRMVRVCGEECRLTAKGLELLQEGLPLKKILRRAKKQGKFVSVSFDAATWSGDDLLIAFARYGKLRNLLTGAISDLRGGTILPIQSRYEVLMETGRTSSSGPNIQNQRKEPGVRECFVARLGYVLAACDFDMAELHTLAQVCYDLFGFSKLGDALNEGIDVHVWVASLLEGIEYEDALELYKAGDERMAGLRQLAKAANFGFPGGCSAARFVAIAKSWGLLIDVREAARIKAVWMQAWPELSHYFAYISDCEVGNGLYWVMQARVNRLRSNCTYTSACNSYFQGLAADGAKAALYEVTKAQFDPDSPLFGSACVAFVHDEILIEAPAERAHEAALELRRIMEREFNKFVPDCPTKATPVLMIHWSKKAKAKFDEEGRMIPWETAA